MNNRLLLISQRVLVSGNLRPAGILVEDGLISQVASPGNFPDSVSREDYGDAVIMPGLIDAHVHINEPGRTEWEGFETATRAAAAGGITMLADMPLNSSPVITTVEALQAKREAAAGKVHVDFTCYGGLIPGSESHIESLLDAGVPGIKTFLSHSGLDEFPNSTEKELRTVMPLLARRDIPLLVHAELHNANIPAVADPDSYRQYERSRPPRWELQAIELLIKLCRETGCPVHIVHLSAAEALPVLQQARSEGLPLTVETAPHYLFFASEQIPDADPRYKCAPPIRGAENRDALWEGLQAGIIDFIATDHSPSSPELKRGTLQKSWGGISSLQLMLPAIWTSGKIRNAKIADVCRWTSSLPAKFLGLESSHGEIAEDREANFVVWHPEESFTVDATSLHHRHKITPYDGQTLFGTVKATWLRGKKIYGETGLPECSCGREILNIQEPLKYESPK